MVEVETMVSDWHQKSTITLNADFQVRLAFISYKTDETQASSPQDKTI